MLKKEKGKKTPQFLSRNLITLHGFFFCVQIHKWKSSTWWAALERQYAYIQQLSTHLIFTNETNVAFILFYILHPTFDWYTRPLWNNLHFSDKRQKSLCETLIRNKKFSTSHKLIKDLLWALKANIISNNQLLHKISNPIKHTGATYFAYHTLRLKHTLKEQLS